MTQRILVVEDDTIQADSIAYLLKMRGYDSRSVLNGEAALSVLAVNKFDLLLVDLYMPGINGVELARKLREVCCSSVPIVLMTAADVEVIRDIQSYSESLKPLSILQKPFTMDVLVSTIATLILTTKLYPMGEGKQPNEDGEKEHSTSESVLSPMPNSKTTGSEGQGRSDLQGGGQNNSDSK